MRVLSIYIKCLFIIFISFLFFSSPLFAKDSKREIVIIEIDAPISPATDDYLKSSLKEAEKRDAKLFILKLNTPGGLLNSMQSMVQSLLESKVPTVVYVSPSGGSATSAGVFITLAANFSVMAQGTTIGAAHPVNAEGEELSGDMRLKLENYSVSLIKAIAEQRGKNVKWAEKAVRESVSITDREALEKGVIDFISSDINRLLEELEGKEVKVKGEHIKTLSNLKEAPIFKIEMSFKQKIISVLANPNITILLGLAAMLGIGLELYHPGGILPGVMGVICLVLSLTSSQVLPINYGGAALMILAALFFVIEAFSPSFGIFGGAGILCLIIGSIYLIDSDMIWGGGTFFGVNFYLVSILSIFVGCLLLGASYLVIKASSRKYLTGKAGLNSQIGEIIENINENTYRVRVNGELWKGVFSGDKLEAGDKVRVSSVSNGLVLKLDKMD